MKKIFLLLTAILVAITGYCAASRNICEYRWSKFELFASKQLSDTLLSISLNGIDSLKADTMKKHFLRYRGQDDSPTKESVWFDRETFQRMVNLLLKERGPNHPDLDTSDIGQTDGIRIYFVSNISTSTGHLQNSILVVSTKKSGIDNTVPSKSTHCDYYQHSKNDPLFQDTSAIHGAVAKRPWFFINFLGAKLYNPYLRFLYNDANQTCGNILHYISRGKANKMVNQFGKSAITTKNEWFDIKLLKSFADDKVHDGMRIYFTRHPANYKTVPDTDSAKEAFVFITTESIKNRHVDYFDCATTYSYFFKNERLELWQKRHPLGGGGGGGGDDNGELCPTHCP